MNLAPAQPDPATSALPYTDTKPVGHADFYFAINATFRFILRDFDHAKLVDYWRDLGAGYYKPVAERWKARGLAGVAEYWRAFFKAEPGADVVVHETAEEVRLEVKTCPLIKHLRDGGREIVPCFCQHCFYVSDAIGASAGIAARIKGGGGSCEQRFVKRTADLAPQNLEEIATAS